jgi:sugar/nucleoside kinase (ribokinase family)
VDVRGAAEVPREGGTFELPDVPDAVVADIAFLKARNRIVTLPVDGRYVVETTLEVLATADAVAAVESEIEILQSQGQPTVNPGPREPFAAEG